MGDLRLQHKTMIFAGDISKGKCKVRESLILFNPSFDSGFIS